MKYLITIKTESTSIEDIIAQLAQVSADLRNGFRQGPTRDDNGERVGSFSVSREEVHCA